MMCEMSSIPPPSARSNPCTINNNSKLIFMWPKYLVVKISNWQQQFSSSLLEVDSVRVHTSYLVVYLVVRLDNHKAQIE